MLKFIFQIFKRATMPQKACYILGTLLILFSFWHLLRTFLRAFPFVAMAVVGVVLIVLAAARKI